MHPGPHPTLPILSDDERATLEALARRRKTPRGLATRASIFLTCADNPNWSTTAVARHLGLSRDTIRTWRNRFEKDRLQGLSDAPRSGAPRRIHDQHVEPVLRLTPETLPEDATNWSTRSMARASGLSQSAVSRVWRAFALRPHLSQSFKLTSDPLFIEKVRDEDLPILTAFPASFGLGWHEWG